MKKRLTQAILIVIAGFAVGFLVLGPLVYGWGLTDPTPEPTEVEQRLSMALDLATIQTIKAEKAARNAAASAEATWDVAYEAAYADLEQDFTPFTDLVQTSLKGVVHLQAPSWQGSGFVAGPQLIVTARHCVEGVEDFVITTHDGHQVRTSRAISDKEHDVAFIWVDDLECIAEERGTKAHSVELIALPLGSIKDCVLGQSIYVIGSPYGKKHFNALTMGVVSMTTMDVDNYGVNKEYGWATLFMTDAATWGGSSGCPIFTTDGIVRGVLVGGHGQEENTSYCVPIDVILPDISMMPLMFTLDRYEIEEAIETTNQSWEEDLYEVYEAWPGYGQ